MRKTEEVLRHWGKARKMPELGDGEKAGLKFKRRLGEYLGKKGARKAPASKGDRATETVLRGIELRIRELQL